MDELPVMGPEDMPVSALVGDEVERVSPGDSLVEVARRLTEAQIGLVVVGEGDRPVGVVSERDIVRAVADGLDLATATASDIAHTELAWVDPAATVHEVATEMMSNWVRHVLVGADGAMVGIVSVRDVVGAYASATSD